MGTEEEKAVDWTEGLTKEQAEGFRVITSYINNDLPGYHEVLLTGGAGTGKSFLVNRIRDWYTKSKKWGQIALTAPTNQAVKVLMSMEEEPSVRVAYCTIHSALTLKEYIDPNSGELSFKPDNRPGAHKEPLKGINVLMIDEASMLDDNIMKYLDKARETYPNIKVIYIGDDMQCPPVNHIDSIPMLKEEQERRGIYVVQLNEIMRQAADNPIIKYSVELREQRYRPVLTIDSVDEVNDGSGVQFINGGVNPNNITVLLSRLFASQEFKEDKHFIRVMAFRNKTVAMYNEHIRRIIFGEDIRKLEIGDRLITNAPVILEQGNTSTILFSTSEELEVIGYDIKETTVLKTYLKYYDTHVKYWDTKKKRYATEYIGIIHEETELVLDSLIDKLINDATRLSPGTEAKKKAWFKYWTVRRFFADVKHAYATTVHKCQGSTYKNAIVIDKDISSNRAIEYRNRLRYTAATRGSDMLYMIE